jgi:hypothetical protein
MSNAMTFNINVSKDQIVQKLVEDPKLMVEVLDMLGKAYHDTPLNNRMRCMERPKGVDQFSLSFQLQSIAGTTRKLMTKLAQQELQETVEDILDNSIGDKVLASDLRCDIDQLMVVGK